MTDPIADMLTRIRNAQMSGKRSVLVPYSGFKNELARVLKEAGFVLDTAKRGRRNNRMLDIVLMYDEKGSGRIRGLRMVSKQSRRSYAGFQDLRDSRRGVGGMCVVSTSRGVMSSVEARKARIGGEVVCEVW
ncbi:MAG: 30S ribosomal protein S8, partial [Patescibacteria group bacterium]